MRRRKTKEEFISDEFDSMWRRFLGVDDRRFHLECSPEETLYLTRPGDAVAIQEEVAKHIRSVKVFLDAFACVGGDSIAAMFVHREADVHAVQRVRGDEERERFERLGRNLRTVRRVCRRAGVVRWYDVDIGNFLMRGELSCISVLFLDPPWCLGRNPAEISSNEAIREFLWQNVFRFLGGVAPVVICLKLPRRAADVEEWSGSIEYEVVACMDMRRKYVVYVLKRKSARGGR